MSRFSRILVLGSLVFAGCSKPADKPAADTTAAAPPPAPTAFVTVIYNAPKSAAAFEKYYWEPMSPWWVRSRRRSDSWPPS
jgi:hypothetical protein